MLQENLQQLKFIRVDFHFREPLYIFIHGFELKYLRLGMILIFL